MFEAWMTSQDIQYERNLATYGEDILDAINARHDLICDIEDKVNSDEEYEAMTLLIEDETDDLPYNEDNIRWQDTDEVVDIYYTALAILDWCENFYKNYAPMLAGI